VPVGGTVEPFLGGEIHAAVGRAEADARERVDDHAQPVVAAQRLAPSRRLVAVHLAQEPHPIGAGEHALYLRGQFERARDRPLRQHAGVHHQPPMLEVRQRPRAHPVDQRVAVGRGEDVVERVGAVRAADARGHRQQVQVVVAQHRDQPLALRDRPAQAVGRARAAVDDVAGHPDAGIGGQLRQQAQQAVEATLQVADGPGFGTHTDAYARNGS